jgi:hypothetical protein
LRGLATVDTDRVVHRGGVTISGPVPEACASIATGFRMIPPSRAISRVTLVLFEERATV